LSFLFDAAIGSARTLCRINMIPSALIPQLIKSSLRSIIVGLLCLCLFSCTKKENVPKDVAVIVVYKDQGGELRTTVQYTMTKPGTVNADYWAPGNIVIFRVDTAIKEHAGKAGRAYRIQDDLTLKDVGGVNMGKTDEQLFEEFSTMPASQ
jgi:hypothetical protein